MEVSAAVDKKNLAVNESFVFTIRIQSEGEKLDNLDIPDLSDLNDFYFIDQWSEEQASSSINIINGRMHKTKIRTFLKRYRFQPKTSGTLRIETMTIKVNGQKFETKPIFLTVSKESKKPTPSQPSQSPPPLPLPTPFQPPHSLFDIFTKSFLDKTTKKDSLKLRLNLSKNVVYKTEMIQADWFILQSSGSIHYDIYQPPSLKGFWKERIQNKQTNSFLGTQVIDKVLYKKILLDRLWLFPLQTGTLTIDPYSIRINQLFNFSFRSQEEIKLFPNRKIRVKKLPSKGLDASFTGAVGSFAVQAFINEKETVVNQPISYKITFQGLGHPRFITLPALKFPSSAQVYPPAEKSRFSDFGKGTKEFEILIVPKQEGILNIPSFTLSTFDPKTEQYVFHQTASFSIPVKKGDISEEEGETFFKIEKDQQKKSFSLKPLKKSYWPWFINHKNIIKFWFVLFACFLACLLFLYTKNLAFKNEKSFKKQLKQKFKNIQAFLNKKNWQKACTQMIHVNYKALYFAQMQSSPSDWRQALNNLPPSLNKKYALKFETLFKKLEDLSFSPDSHLETEALKEAQTLFENTKTLINRFFSDL